MLQFVNNLEENKLGADNIMKIVVYRGVAEATIIAVHGTDFAMGPRGLELRPWFCAFMDQTYI